MTKRRIGLLTGTFDPVHLGHIAIARAAAAACELEEVWLLVNPDPGHKTGVTALEDRVAMVRLGVAGEAGLREGEPATEAGTGRHTLAGFERLMGRYPDREFVFIMGADVLATLDTWEDADRARELEYAVARRAGARDVAMGDGLRVTWFDLAEHVAASSRRVQDELRAGRRPVELDDSVFTYIWERRLYR